MCQGEQNCHVLAEDDLDHCDQSLIECGSCLAITIGIGLFVKTNDNYSSIDKKGSP